MEIVVPCYKPLTAGRIKLKTGRSKIYFERPGMPLPRGAENLRLPCGQCVGCRLDRSRQWATRCMHEARMHDQNSFITLTYDEKHCPRDGSLVLSHFQKFMKRLRKHVGKTHSSPIKFMHCGEYGEEFKRPHYHALIFGYDLPDRTLWKVRDGIPLYTSACLDSIWGMGFTTVGDVTWESAAYVARYSLKKINGALRDKPDEKTGLKPYERCHMDTGEILEVLPEYVTMSRKPGLGKTFFDEYQEDIFPHDECVVNGHPTRPPRYYDGIWEDQDPDSMELIKEQRIEAMSKFAHDNTRPRLAQREEVQQAKVKLLPRGDL